MSIAMIEVQPRVTEVGFTDSLLSVSIEDGRVVLVPKVWYPRLLHATEAERNDWRVFEYTKSEVAKADVLAALQQGAHVVIGTSGLMDADYADIAQVAEDRQRGVLAAGNFPHTVVLLQKFAEIAAKHIRHWEIIDYAQ